jgi:hypothetical protein
MNSRALCTSIAVLLAMALSRTAAAQIYPTTAAPGASWRPAGPNWTTGDTARRLPPSGGYVGLTPLGGVRLVDYTTGGDADDLAAVEDKAGTKDAVCCPPFWAHRTGVFGEYLLLRPRDAEVAFAVPYNGPIVPPPSNPLQVGPVALVDPDYSSGFRVGGSWAWDECTSLVATYSFFENHTSNEVAVDAPLVLRSLVTHPGTLNAAGDYLRGAADLNVGFQTVDLDYRNVWWLGEASVVNWSLGARYAQLTQDFDSQFDLTGTFDEVATEVDFDGGGVRLGLDGERHNCHGMLLYGRGAMSLVAGEFSGSYFQGSDQDPEIVNTAWQAGRIVPIFDLELGAGWQSPCGHFRLTAGYVVSMWFNTLTTDSWIRSVQQNNFVGQADAISYDTLTFDGFTARAEYRF